MQQHFRLQIQTQANLSRSLSLSLFFVSCVKYDYMLFRNGTVWECAMEHGVMTVAVFHLPSDMHVERETRQQQ